MADKSQAGQAEMLRTAIRDLLPETSAEALDRVVTLSIKPDQDLVAVALFEDPSVLFDQQRVIVVTYKSDTGNDAWGSSGLASNQQYDSNWKVYYGPIEDVQEQGVLRALSSFATELTCEHLSVCLMGMHMGGDVSIGSESAKKTIRF
jgi:hypothetical protein